MPLKSRQEVTDLARAQHTLVSCSFITVIEFLSVLRVLEQRANGLQTL